MTTKPDEITASGRFRRKFLTTSAALVGGGLTLSASTSASSATENPEESTPAELPDFNAQLCTNQLTATVGPEQQRFAQWNESLRSFAAGRESGPPVLSLRTAW